jgi:heptaprenyl diphosphate synthase
MRHDVAANLADYTEVITRKTASLFSAGGEVAADLAGVGAATVAAMQQLGMAVGRAFQMVDDLLDILGPEEKIGKPVGSDLRAGIVSLPVVLGMEASAELRRIFGNRANLDGEALARALEIMREPDIVARAREMAARQVAQARRMLAALRPSAYRDSLATLIDDQINRDV